MNQLNGFTSLFFRRIVKLTFGETIHVVTLLSRSTILKKLDRNIPIIAQCLRFSSNMEWATFLFLTAFRISRVFPRPTKHIFQRMTSYASMYVVMYQR